MPGASAAARGGPDLLTTREQTVLRLVAERYDNQAVAVALGISKRTVETHVASLLRKLAVPDRRTLISTSGHALFRARLTGVLLDSAEETVLKTETAWLLGQHLGADRADYRDVTPSTPDPLDLAARGTRTVMVRDASRELDPAAAAAWAACSVRAGIVAPGVRGGVCVAALGVFSTRPRDWTTEDVALVEDTAQRTWAQLERLRLDRELRAERASFHSLAEAVPHLVWRADSHQQLVHANHAFRSLTGLGPGDSLVDVLVPDEAGTETSGWHGCLWVRCSDGAFVCCEAHLTPRVGPDQERQDQIGVAQPQEAPTGLPHPRPHSSRREGRAPTALV